jgi:RHS repeat-associated protein
MNTISTFATITFVMLASHIPVPDAHAYYDAANQRWITRDPIGESGFGHRGMGLPQLGQEKANEYSFVHNNPSGENDPFGLSAQCNQQPPKPDCFKNLQDCQAAVGVAAFGVAAYTYGKCIQDCKTPICYAQCAYGAAIIGAVALSTGEAICYALYLACLSGA